ncbi:MULTISPECIES: glycoside hydrolase family 88 protein [unclassified Pseudoclavibacter]|uniref:glycoside hydrolase family 88 protein n=1 Tax=unclassified Pseudoclavibacter TaxID=2615177 RepID=UPI000CE8106E|nr:MULTISPECIES: glycoside hydrolase family 88 protein [unclassified Pseudoclavibacter]PPF34277.1 glucuronyl hydrolase [Pseudoclavibacter sp. AY1H1]PPF77592.1 glucuronyl hydrolase [Pseudoclavibacter sp. Z016]
MTFAPASTTVENALAAATETVRRNIVAFGAAYPDDTTTDGRYLLRPATEAFAEGANRGWTTSFWPGMMWLAGDVTGDAAFHEAALAHAADFERRLYGDEDLETHDLGFLYSLSVVTAWKQTGDERWRTAGVKAGERLMTRFLEPAGILQAWGDLSDPAQRGRAIIDSLMNMPLLTWVGEQTGDPRYADAVRRHTEQLRTQIFRADDSTFHTFYWDAETGEPLRGGTEQGAFDESCWARGEAWGIYGFALNSQAVGDPRQLEAAWRCADYYLAHLPSDGIPYWDLVYTEGSDAPRDSSAAAIAACGFFELAAVEPDPERSARARAAAYAQLDALIAEATPRPAESSDALLLHGVYDMPKLVGVDEGTLWGDYFFLEALTRASRPDWQRYW